MKKIFAILMLILSFNSMAESTDRLDVDLSTLGIGQYGIDNLAAAIAVCIRMVPRSHVIYYKRLGTYILQSRLTREQMLSYSRIYINAERISAQLYSSGANVYYGNMQPECAGRLRLARSIYTIHMMALNEKVYGDDSANTNEY